jgi:hypothetical protein
MDATGVLLTEVTNLPGPLLAGGASARVRALGLSWAGDASLRLLEVLPVLLPKPPSCLPKSWYRHVYCLASMSARLAPRAPDDAIQQALLSCSALQLLAACTPGVLLTAQAAARDQAISLVEALAGLGVEMAALEAGIGRSWRLPPAHDPVIAGHAVLIARWLLGLKRMPSPVDPHPPEPSAGQLRSLGLGADALVAAIASMTAAVDDGRRLQRLVGERSRRR